MNNDNEITTTNNKEEKVQAVEIAIGVEQLNVLLPGVVHPVNVDVSFSSPAAPSAPLPSAPMAPAALVADNEFQRVVLYRLSAMERTNQGMVLTFNNRLDATETVHRTLYDGVDKRIMYMEEKAQEFTKTTGNHIAKLFREHETTGNRITELFRAQETLRSEFTTLARMLHSRVDNVVNNASDNKIQINKNIDTFINITRTKLNNITKGIDETDKCVADMENQVNTLERKFNSLPDDVEITLDDLQGKFNSLPSDIDDQLEKVDTIEGRLDTLCETLEMKWKADEVRQGLSADGDENPVKLRNQVNAQWKMIQQLENDIKSRDADIKAIKERLNEPAEDGKHYPMNSLGAQVNGLKSQVAAIQSDRDKYWAVEKEQKVLSERCLNLNAEIHRAWRIIDHIDEVQGAIDAQGTAHEKAISNILHHQFSLNSTENRENYRAAMLTLGFTGEELLYAAMTEGDILALIQEEIDSGEFDAQNLNRLVIVGEILKSRKLKMEQGDTFEEGESNPDNYSDI